MEALFEWKMEGEGERDLKALPFVVAWFERAGAVRAGEAVSVHRYNIEEESYLQSFNLLLRPYCLFLLLILKGVTINERGIAVEQQVRCKNLFPWNKITVVSTKGYFSPTFLKK